MTYLRSDLRRSVLSWRFAGLTLLIPLIMMLSISDYIPICLINGKDGANSAFSKLYEILVFDRFKPVMVVLLSSLCCPFLGNDLKTGFYRQQLTRGSRHDYIYSKLISNSICITLSTVLGFLLFIAAAAVFMPLRYKDPLREGPGTFGPWWCLINGPFPLLYPIVTALQFSAYVVFLSTVSIWVSVYRPSRYLALAVPYVLFYILYAVTTFLPRPFWVWYISSSVRCLPTTDFLTNWLYGLAFFILPTILCMWGCARSFERRW